MSRIGLVGENLSGGCHGMENPFDWRVAWGVKRLEDFHRVSGWGKSELRFVNGFLGVGILGVVPADSRGIH